MAGTQGHFKADIKLRSLVAGDSEFLADMLFETLMSEPDAADMSREMLSQPDLAWYIEEWGREGDFGFAALDAEGNPVGAVWARLANDQGKGYGFFDFKTPEIAIATTPFLRGLGIGSRLLKTLIDKARDGYPALSLSVASKNPAKRLYERFGFKTVATEKDHSLMVFKLSEVSDPK